MLHFEWDSFHVWPPALVVPSWVADTRSNGAFVSGHTTLVAPSEACELQQCCDDVERLSRLAMAWKERDPTSIAESILETLLELLDLDFVGLRFNNAPHIFRRVGEALGQVHDRDTILTAINAWLRSDPQHPPPTLSIGSDQLFAVSLPLGDISSMGQLFAASHRAGFPQQTVLLKLRIGASQASLAFREVHELKARLPPADLRAEKPSGEALAQSEWTLNLIINTIPAMAWSATADGMLDFCNQHFLDFVGLPAEEILG